MFVITGFFVMHNPSTIENFNEEKIYSLFFVFFCKTGKRGSCEFHHFDLVRLYSNSKLSFFENISINNVRNAGLFSLPLLRHFQNISYIYMNCM